MIFFYFEGFHLSRDFVFLMVLNFRKIFAKFIILILPNISCINKCLNHFSVCLSFQNCLPEDVSVSLLKMQFHSFPTFLNKFTVFIFVFASLCFFMSLLFSNFLSHKSHVLVYNLPCKWFDFLSCEPLNLALKLFLNHISVFLSHTSKKFFY